MKTNYHTHSYFCDGNGVPEEYVQAAIAQGFTHLGFSGHAPLPFENTFALHEEQMSNYIATIRHLQQQYAEKIKIYLGLEADYIPGFSKDFRIMKEMYGLDYLIGSVHLVKSQTSDELWFTDGSNISTYDEGLQQLFGNDIKAAVKAFFLQTDTMISEQHPDVIGHFDKVKMNNKGRYFSEEESWYHDLVMETLRLIKESGCVCEINSRAIYKERYSDYFPGSYLWPLIAAMNIPVMINSDAHKPDEVGLLTNETLALAKTKGIKEVWYFEDGWKSQAH